MKLASLKSGRDGKLVVVSRDLTRAAPAEKIAPTMQAALDDWANAAPKLAALAQEVESGKAQTFAFDTMQCAAPLPRAYQWADFSVYLSHVERARKARNAGMEEDAATNPLVYQGGSDSFLGPRDDILMAKEEWGIDFEGEIAAVTGDVPMGTPAKDAEKHIKLLMLVNDVSLRVVAQGELKKGFGFYQGKPATAFGPVAVTPDELGDAWKDAKVHLPMLTWLNGEKYGSVPAGLDMTFNFAAMIQHAAMTRDLCAGSIIGSGTVSNYDLSNGFSCIVEKRLVEKIETGASTSPFMKFGDTVRIEMKDAQGKSVFGAIEQTVKPYKYG
jgi:fumarylacetoacetate (FAA) hydrolase